MLLDDISDYIATLGYGVPVQKGFFQEIPDTVIALRETGGFVSEHIMGDQKGVLDQPTIQVVTRSKDYQSCMILCRTLHLALDGLRATVLNNVTYHFVKALQPPFFLQRDHNNRFECAFNIHVQRSVT